MEPPQGPVFHPPSTHFPFWNLGEATCLVDKLCPTLSTPKTVDNQAPLYTEFVQARILERVATSFSRGSSRPRDQTCISFIGSNNLKQEVGDLDPTITPLGIDMNNTVTEEPTCVSQTWSL